MNRIRNRLSTLLAPRLLALCAVAALLPPSLAAQQAEPAPTFGEVVDVRVINLEVVVTRGKERVAALASDDFQLLVDGREVPIEYFTEVREGTAVNRGLAGETVAVPALEPGEPVGTRYLVFVDDYFAIPSFRNQVLRRLAEQLPSLRPQDRMAIVAFDGHKVEMLSSWTRSLPQLENAIAQAIDRRAYGLQRQSEQRRFDTFARFGHRLPSAPPGFYPFGGRFDYDYEALDVQRFDELTWQTSRVIDAATSSLRAFARPPGRKVMLLLSGGWPSSTLFWHTTATFGPLYPEGYADQRAFNPLIDTANRLGYTLYPVDLNGSYRALRGGAEFGSIGEASYAAAINQEREWREEDTLNLLAATTGGRAFLDGARFDALERAAEDTRSYYWLGFSPTWEQNDRRHKVEVKVRSKGMKVRARGSFSDLSRQSEMTMMVESAQLFDLPLPGQAGLAVTFGEPERSGFGKVTVPVRLEIPLDRVTVLSANGGFTAHLELRVAATDNSGATSDIPVIPVQLNGSRPPEDGETGFFETQLKLRSKPHRLLLSLYDPPTGNVLSKRVELSL